MPGPYGIEMFDAGNALSALQAGRDARVKQMLLKRQMDAEDLAAKKQAGVQSALSAYAGSAKTADDRSGLVNGLLAIDPDTAMKFSDHFSKMDADQAKQARDNATRFASMAFQLKQLPADQRRAALQNMAPILGQMGFSADQLQSAQLDDQSLDMIIAQGRDIEKLVDGAKPNLRSLSPGDILIDANTGKQVAASPLPKIIFGPDGPYALGPIGDGVTTGGGAQSGVGAGGAPPHISSKQQYDALAPGAQYMAPDGSIRTKGGPTPRASGAFPGQ